MKKKYPHEQEFNIHGVKNKTKQHSWWQHAPYHNNGKRGK